MRGDEKELYTQQYLSPQLSNLLEFISVQQKRIADAQEKKADAEERKADALQKRAEAQKLMADALNKIAEALYGKYKELTSDDKPDGIVDDLLHTPVDTASVPESPSETDQETDTAETETAPSETEENSHDPAPEVAETEASETEAAQTESRDEEEPEPFETGSGDDEEEPAVMEVESSGHAEEPEPVETEEPSGDEGPETIEAGLPESEPDENSSKGELEDVSSQPGASETAEEETIPNDYKSKIISRIITLKEKKGFSIDATVSYLNEKGFKPISTEGPWDRDMVSKIFSHINTVRKKRDR